MRLFDLAVSVYVPTVSPHADMALLVVPNLANDHRPVMTKNGQDFLHMPSIPMRHGRMTMLPAQIVFLAASKAVLGMASESGLWAAATLQPGTAILAGVQARPRPNIG